MYIHSKEIITAGVPVEEAEKAIIMIHGRGATAVSIASLEKNLKLKNTAVFAPQATNHSWYPYSFLAPVIDNQPALDSALETIGQVLDEVIFKGIPKDKISFLGFSQGACLALEFAARNADKYAGVVAFTGGLIGENLATENYAGDFQQTPFLITTGDPDPHVPVQRVEASVAILTKLNADITLRIYKHRPHTITMEEIELAQKILKA